MTNWEKYFGTPDAVRETLDSICDSGSTKCEKCPFYRCDGCVVDNDWLESEGEDGR